ncbi:MAG: PHP domain-containing protein, partial [Actinomycetota bacterium]
MLDGASRIGDVVDAAARDGQPALGITDHGNMYGVLDFYRACHDRGVKPIIGTEAYMLPWSVMPKAGWPSRAAASRRR